MKQGWSSFMDRRVKERLIGATILVVLIVLIVPELLSGPKQSAPPAPLLLVPSLVTDPVRNVTVDLATSRATQAADDAAASATPPAPVAATPEVAPPGTISPATAPGTETVPPDTGTATSDMGTGTPGTGRETPGRATAGEAPPTIATLKAQEPAASTKTAVPRDSESARTGHRSWTVQLGSFASRNNADKLARQLRAQGSAVNVSSSGSGRSLRYRVRTAPMADRAAAERAAAKLKAQGHAASVVTPTT
jgi:DedD protein